ncbi:MAG TPA: DUF5683 domain-containing protein [Rhodothermales bacterium]|nr:DUF5683 domain-containing protein [Rhodothermales bacterium]
MSARCTVLLRRFNFSPQQRGSTPVRVFALAVLLALVPAQRAAAQNEGAQPDSTQEIEGGSFWWPNNLPEGHSPKGALLRAAVLPGWGQFYNRQYVKIPVVWAGLGAITVFALRQNSQYLTFRHAYLYAYYNNPEEERPPEYCDCYADDYRKALSRMGVQVPGPGADDQVQRGQLAPTLRQYRDVFRRNRDLTYFGIGVVYGLTVLDAYVSAHLLDFDVGEDLTLSVTPGLQGVSATLRLGLR